MVDAGLQRGAANAATAPDGVSHWGDAKVIASLAAAAVLLAVFAVIETGSTDPLLSVRVLRRPVRRVPDHLVHPDQAPGPVRRGPAVRTGR